MVLENNINFDENLDPNGVDDTYKIYIKGGPWTEQTVLLTEDGAEDWVMRRSPTVDAISSILIIATTDSPDLYPGNDFLYLDDFYVTMGEDLSSPAGAADWYGYPVMDGWANTDEVGMVYIEHDPWVYSAELEKYLHVGEFISGGAWFYVPR